MAQHQREDDKTIGEVYRRLVDMDERYEKKLDGIDQQVRLTNGRTTKLEANYDNLHSAVRRLQDHPAAMVAPADTGESLLVKISPKMWVAMAAAGGMLFPKLIVWLSAWLDRS